MFERQLADTLLLYKKFPVIALLGPRQSGKTTLAQMAFPNHKFLSLDDEPIRSFAVEDPDRFFASYENDHGIILDEFQYAPKLTSYIKRLVDEKKRPGYFVLTGSQNFLVNQNITESLAGRVGILSLLPLSLAELENNNLYRNEHVDQVILDGCYPRIYNEDFKPTELYPSYIQSYIEKDVRQLINVGNLSTFQKFVALCAGRIGNLVNIEGLAVECGVTFPTIKAWLSILEASYIIYFLQPHFNNFNKRLVKTPKLYFYDTGLACSLLRIRTTETLAMSPFRGALFESLIITDLYKQFCNRGIIPPLYFWRDHGGLHEVDCIVDLGPQLYPIEIKSGQTFSSDFFRGLNYWNEIAQAPATNGYLIYGGKEVQVRSQGNVSNWRSAENLVDKLVPDFSPR